MLGSILFSFLVALICSGICIAVCLLSKAKLTTKRIISSICLFFANFFYLLLVFYFKCIPVTFVSAIIYIWPIIILEIIVFLFIFDYSRSYEPIELVVLTCIFGISILLRLSILFAPVQNLIFVHDMEEIDISYAISSDEILAKVML